MFDTSLSSTISFMDVLVFSKDTYATQVCTRICICVCTGKHVLVQLCMPVLKPSML